MLVDVLAAVVVLVLVVVVLLVLVLAVVVIRPAKYEQLARICCGCCSRRELLLHPILHK